MRTLLTLIVGLAVLVEGGLRDADALGTAFTYQGRLVQGGGPVTNSCDLQFGLFDAAADGNQLGLTQELNAVAVVNGLFTVQLNGDAQFGPAAFNGSDRFLQVATRCPTGAGSFIPLAPRQSVTATPYASWADRVANLRAFPLANTAVGVDALASNIDGHSNTAVGEKALQLNSLGYLNTAVGIAALGANTEGAYNTAVGSAALLGNTVGSNNTAVGRSSLSANLDGSGNTALGRDALLSQTEGDENTVVGHRAMIANVTGSSNTAVGNFALAFSKGQSNTALGNRAGINLEEGDNNIYIGNEGSASTSESGVIKIGTPGAQTTTFIAGIHSTTVSGAAVLISNGGQLGVQTSSGRFKEDVTDMGETSSVVLRLRPVRFRYKRNVDPSGAMQYGLVAEEVAKVDPDLVITDETGRPETVRYHLVNAMLLNEVQKQARQLDAQRRQLDEQARQLAALTSRLLQVEGTLAAPDGARTLPVGHGTKAGL